MFSAEPTPDLQSDVGIDPECNSNPVAVAGPVGHHHPVAFEFRRLTDDDLPLMHRWLNEPGVVRWWEGDDLTWEGVVADYGSGADPTVEHWLALREGEPVGWVQCFAIADEPDDEEVQVWLDLGVEATGSGIDYLIGDPTRRGTGLGSEMIDAFVGGVVFGRHPDWTSVCASPLEANVASWRALEKAGFVRTATFEDTSGTCVLMVRHR